MTKTTEEPSCFATPHNTVLLVCLCEPSCKGHIPVKQLENQKVLLHYVDSRGDIVPFSSKDIEAAKKAKVEEVIEALTYLICSECDGTRSCDASELAAEALKAKFLTKHDDE